MSVRQAFAPLDRLSRRVILRLAELPLRYPTSPALPAHMLGNFAPVADELTSQQLEVTGAIPPELTGWYLRNGPNPHAGAPNHWFAGDGMVHGVRLEGGRASTYRNRWVRTSAIVKGASMYDKHGRRDLTAGAANTHIVRHAGKVLALNEASLPFELSCEPGRELETIGSYDFGGRLHTAMTAHPKTCPTTGELHFFGYGGQHEDSTPYITYHRANAEGKLTVSRPIEVAHHTMMHDFNLTAGHVVFMDLPLAIKGTKSASESPFTWLSEQTARLGVLRRDDPYGDVRWFEIQPCYVFHALNAHEEAGGQRLVLHVIRHPAPTGAIALFASGATLWRWTVDLATGAVSEEQLDDHPAEFPRVDDRLAGLPTDQGYATSAHGINAGPHIHRFNLRNGSVDTHAFTPGRTPDEATFVPADDRPGGPGWLMTFVYDAMTDRSDLVILDADDLTRPPVAIIHLPQRVPIGFHGNWLPDSSTSD